ncbi:phosphate transporter PHO1 3-like protein [Cinnamomum micranthum f. kanehirae]|uniref:Phosphate transporter PHO1 3-like protein n=1 Tax=Cinnamomum micranthum f. kanehirae TaxID=337451 RepID=A0A3S3MPX7_9MAGN|nr:phosphate transporter PHO1 3-like protein [Cinnamomum micranthum f. kanehirae]
MKFGKEFAAQMVPEWQQAYMDYNMLKNILKDILRYRLQRIPPSPAAAAPASGGGGGGLKRKMTMYRAFSGLTRRYSNLRSGGEQEQTILVNRAASDGDGDGERSSERYETMFLMASDEGGEYEIVYFKRLDDEFNKANSFYRAKVQEVMAEADALTRQTNALIAFRLRVENPGRYHQGFLTSSLSPSTTTTTTSYNTPDLLPTPRRRLDPSQSSTSGRAGPMPNRKSSARDMGVIQEVELSSEGSLRETTKEISVIEVDETHNHRSGPEKKPHNKSSKPAPLEVLNHVKINVALETPRSTIKGMLMDSKCKELSFSKEELRKAEEQLKRAFVEFYHKLRLLKSYSFMNLLAFSKIMKKYDKITSRSASRSYLNMVDNSYLGSSDEVTRLLERVEATFIKHFSNSNRRKGMNTLKPTARRERHMTTFLLGFAAGCSIALLVALNLIVRTRNIYNKAGSKVYMNTMFQLYSLFGFVVLHMLTYAANIYFWRRYRVNYPFIFGFKQGTELGYREVFLLSTSLAVLALAGVLANLDMEMDKKTGNYNTQSELVPLGLVAIVLVITFCPFNIIYRSSRIFLLRCVYHCICAPLYKVTLPDFFLADQLTSQVQAIRSLEFYICYYGWENFKRREDNCSTYPVYKMFYFTVAVIPYWARFLQCIRCMFEEKDAEQGYNGLKYLATITAVVMRTAYEIHKGFHWKTMAGISSILATIINIYWDIVLDWGLLQKNSKNRWLRDKLLVSHKSVYYAAMVLNILLRFAWLQSVLGFQVSFLHINALLATFSCLEIIRRGIWNFFRLENEHLNNVGKFRAFKSVPLPFNYDTDDEKDE